ncbi:hypothetical protein GGR54DRAFT_646769 [Hypoxylon sp. NC1633]|nr:hypothetical protein GGR54DRAFT_646769 [Hypoxylon sp. NC1633]
MATLALQTRRSPFAPQPHILRIPVELRLMIYKEIFEDVVERGIGLYPFDGLFFPDFNDIRLLEVCKQIRTELAPIIYNKVEIGSARREANNWARIFSLIAPHNTSLFTEFTFDYRFHAGSSFLPHPNEISEEKDKWQKLHSHLAHADLAPRLVTIYMTPCQGCSCWAQQLGQSKINPANCWENPAVGFEYTDCFIYQDLKFLKFVTSCFAKAERIEFWGAVDPLWLLFIRRKLGFIVLRDPDYEYGQYQEEESLRACVLINPKVFNPDRDLKGYIRAGSMEGVYDWDWDWKLVEEVDYCEEEPVDRQWY